MNFSQLKASLVSPKKVYLLEGEDAFFRTRGEEMIKRSYLVEPDFNQSNFEGSALKNNLEPLISALGMCPFLGDYRVICISEWYPTAQDLKNKELNRFLNSDLTSTIVIINNKQKCDGLKKQSSVEFVDCKKGDVDIICKYIQNEAKKNQLIISRSNCEMIAEFCLYDMSKISVEVEKLICYSLFSAEITAETINMLVTKETDYKVYEIVNFIAEKKYDKAYEILNETTEIGEQQMLLASLYYHFRRLLLVSVSVSTDSVLAARLGVKEYAIKKSREQARKFSPRRLMKITQKLIDYDAQFKSGEIALTQALNNAVFMILTEK